LKKISAEIGIIRDMKNSERVALNLGVKSLTCFQTQNIPTSFNPYFRDHVKKMIFLNVEMNDLQ
jgi:hypothetical protein